MKKIHRNLLIALAAAAAVIAVVVLQRWDSITIHLPAAVQTLAEGYEVVGPLKRQLRGEAQLSSADIEVACGDGDFPISKLSLAFVVKNRAGQKIRIISVDNHSRTAYVEADAYEASAAWASIFFFSASGQSSGCSEG